ncbi:serine/threonine protein kinase [Labilithrix luteola]|uniref:Serine/threonine protein kinase n=1 Tax=Labilithrix luteola TaxID=1391654 RepID=A0A0K1Q1E7_9BACT|nr:serine/threonine-protein kinase [Labilithrix luteola]AKU99562.1 serine/threonine protein kinase [Labilithrix luteola]
MSARELKANGPAERSSLTGSLTGSLSAKYRSLFVLGRGGMGAVEAALELQGDGIDGEHRVVALKRLLPEAARDKRRVEMFMREARLARMLHHPNVVGAYDYGEADGELYLAMEYIEGQPLSRLLKALAEKGKTLDAGLVAHLVAEVCEGLHAAHELRDDDGEALNVVHRDVSPQNVMVGYDGHVRLLDFGVAKIEAESVTKTGEVKGKSAYMSPEQAMGDPLDRRSDLFGVGAVLFECLTNRRMWGDGTDMEVIRKLALDAPPSLAEAAPEAPREIRALYTKLVARSADDRPSTAGDVANELRASVRLAPETAARALRAVLDEYFGQHAAEQRQRLADALSGKKAERRSSIPPSIPPAASTTPPPPVARAKPAAADATRGGRPFPAMAGVVVTLSIVALGAWKLTGAPATASPPIASAVVMPPAPTSAPSPAEAHAPPTTTMTTMTVTSAVASASPPVAPPSRSSGESRPAHLHHAPATSATPSVSTTATATVVAPAPSTPPRAPAAAASSAAPPSPKPLDVDDHPF